MNAWFGRLLFVALAVALVAIIVSMIPLGGVARDQPEGVVLSPEAPPPAEVAPPEYGQ